MDDRDTVQGGAVACGLLIVFHLMVLFSSADGGMKLGAVLGTLICGVIAWQLWTRNSVAAGVGALIVLSLEAAGLVIAGVIVSPNNGHFAGAVVAFLMVLVGYQTMRSARRIHRREAERD